MTRNLFFRILLFLIGLVVVFFGNLAVFRSDLPILWFATTIGSAVGFIYFPYNKFFNTKKTN